jgi:hypothetical protein
MDLVFPIVRRVQAKSIADSIQPVMPVTYDEAQAFLSTGIWWKMEKIRGIKKRAKIFNSIFKRYESQIRKV